MPYPSGCGWTFCSRPRAAALAVAVVGVAALVFLLSRQGNVAGNQAAGDRANSAGAPVSFERMKLTRLTTTGKTSDAGPSRPTASTWLT